MILHDILICTKNVFFNDVVEIRLNVWPVSTKSFAATPHISMSRRRPTCNWVCFYGGSFTCLNAYALRLCSVLFHIPGYQCYVHCDWLIDWVNVHCEQIVCSYAPYMLYIFCAYALLLGKSSMLLMFRIQCSIPRATNAQDLHLVLLLAILFPSVENKTLRLTLLKENFFQS